MPRSPSVSGLTLLELERLVSKRRGELQRLYRRREAIEKRIADLDRRIYELGGRPGRPPLGRGFRRTRNAHSLTETLQTVLAKAGKPMRVRDLVRAVLATGYRSTSANFRAVVNQMLIKDPRFVSAGRGIYQLKK